MPKSKRGNNAPMRTLHPSELDTLTEPERERGYKEERVRCGRCGGTGSYSGGRCFGCEGRAYVWGRAYTPEKRRQLDEANERRAVRKQEKAEEARRSGYLVCVSEYPDAYAAMAEVMDDVTAHGREVALDKWGDFIVDVSTKGYNARITEKQASSIVRAVEGRKKYMEKVAEDDDNASPVIEGRQTITGEVLVTKWKSTMYGDALKMLVRDDRGFKVWGTMPKALRVLTPDVDKGDRVRFEASVEKSDDDETFGFFKSPRGGEKVDG